jgi:hypothetical protein
LDNFRDLALNVVSSGLAFVVGVSLHQIVSWWRIYKERKFWGKGASEAPTVIFLGSHEQVRNVTVRDYEPSGLAGIGDARAVHELTSLLGSAHIDARVAYTDSPLAGQTKQNLVILGTADSNPLMVHAFGELPIRLEYIRQSPTVIRDHATGIDYAAKMEDSTVVKDYGALVRCHSPFNVNRSLIFMYGIFGFGTWGAARLVADANFRRRCDSLGSFEFECLFEVTVMSGEPEIVKVLDLRTLGTSSPGKSRFRGASGGDDVSATPAPTLSTPSVQSGSAPAPDAVGGTSGAREI